MIGEVTLLISVKRAIHKYWNKEVKTKKPEQLGPSHLHLDFRL
jgi:hypothetical protein